MELFNSKKRNHRSAAATSARRGVGAKLNDDYAAATKETGLVHRGIGTSTFWGSPGRVNVLSVKNLPLGKYELFMASSENILSKTVSLKNNGICNPKLLF